MTKREIQGETYTKGLRMTYTEIYTQNDKVKDVIGKTQRLTKEVKYKTRLTE